MNVMVLGGAGYIGSHAVRMLQSAGHTPIIFDDLSRGFEDSIPEDVPFIKANCGDTTLVCDALKKHNIECVMHFAAFASVPESVEKPEMYWENNVECCRSVLNAMRTVGVNKFVFSSTAATYGIPKEMPITEDTPQEPCNPYGETKLQCEHDLAKASEEWGLQWVAPRYFNACGAYKDGSIGESHNPETHMIPCALQVALNKREQFSVYGTDYETPDGSCVRDYIHIEDLCNAHIIALDKLKDNQLNRGMNLGTGQGFSVLEILNACREVTGHKIPAQEVERRAGDPPTLVAQATLANKLLNWTPKYTNVHEIIETAWRWHKANPNGYLK